jgi:dihydrofolate reductase
MRENLNISLIAAMSENNVIGIDNKLPWHSPRDMQHFKNLTSGKTVVMGRKTYESIGKSLPNRRNIVLTRDPNFKVNGVETYTNIDDLLKEIGEDEIFIIGGGTIYEQFLNLANKIYLTIFKTEIEGDTYFPSLDSDWKEKGVHYYSDEKTDLIFKTYEKEVVCN